MTGHDLAEAIVKKNQRFPMMMVKRNREHGYLQVFQYPSKFANKLGVRIITESTIIPY